MEPFRNPHIFEMKLYAQQAKTVVASSTNSYFSTKERNSLSSNNVETVKKIKNCSFNLGDIL